MTGLVSLNWREDVSLDRIEGVSTHEDGKGQGRKYRIYLRDEEGRDLADHAFQRLSAHPLQLIPAQPGVEALSIDFENGEPVVDKSPVIAWARCFDGSVRIVTPAGVDDGHLWKEGGGYVLMPDGTVHGVTEWVDVVRYETLDGYIKDQARTRSVPKEQAA